MKLSNKFRFLNDILFFPVVILVVLMLLQAVRNPFVLYRLIPLPLWFANNIVYVLVILAFILKISSLKKTEFKKNLFLIDFPLYLSLFILVAEFVLSYVETNYLSTNYIYSHFHIFLYDFKLNTFSFNYVKPYFVFFVILKIIYNSYRFKVIDNSKLGMRENISTVLILSLVCFLFVYIFENISVISSTKQNVQFILGCGTDQVCYQKTYYPNLMNDLQPLISLTPENSFVVLPPQSETWPDTGNIPLARYFLYPRFVTSPTYVHYLKSNHLTNEIYVLSIARNRKGGKGWPDEKTLDEYEKDYPNITILKYSDNYSVVKLYD